MFNELDSVVLVHDLPIHGLSEGARGTVVTVYGNHKAYEVEFMKGAKTIALVTVSPDSLRLLHRYTPVDIYSVAD